MPERTVFEDAVAQLVRRIDWTSERVPPGSFPHTADPVSGHWTTTDDGSWTGGFWVGQLWLAGRLTDETSYWNLAGDWAERLGPRAHSGTVFRGFLFYYGAALGCLLAENGRACELALAGASALADDYNDRVGVIPLGEDAEEAHAIGLDQTNIDGVSSSALLLWASHTTGDPRLREIALSHAMRHAELCLRDDASVCQSASFDTDSGKLTSRYTHKGFTDNSTWARAQAWAMLGYSLAARWARDESRLVELAQRVSDWWVQHVPTDLVAYWDFDAPREEHTERDTSATAIAASSLLRLSVLTQEPTRQAHYRQFAEDTVEALLGYLKPVPGTNGDTAAMLTEGCYNRRLNIATKNELIWGSYYLLESLGMMTGTLDATEI